MKKLKKSRFDLFDWLTETKNNVVCCTAHNDPENKEDFSSKGLVKSHAYSMLNTASVLVNSGQTVKLVRLRNPWCKIEWNGDWSDKSDLWNSVSKEDMGKYLVNDDKDGSFWMSYKDYLHYFSNLDICYLPDER